MVSKTTKPLEWLAATNKRLEGTRVTLEMSGKKNNLSLRATLPAKPWDKDQRSRQQRVSLGLTVWWGEGDKEAEARAKQNLAEAEKIAKQVDVDLMDGCFDWTGFSHIEDPREPEPQTIADWVKLLERDRRPGMKPDTWRYNYETLLSSLPLNEPISEEILCQWIREVDPEGSTMRSKYVTIALGLCELADVPTKNIKKLRRDRPTQPVNPRDLPSDEAIVAMWETICDRDWSWVYGMLATYGLRPHELFRLDLSIWPDVRVLQNSKTGERIVPAIRPEWIKKFELTAEVCLPANLNWNAETANWRLGLKIGQGFKRYCLGSPYDLRHCYARACLEAGLSSDISAKLMGHSREIHERSYRAFIKSSVYVDAAKRAIAANRSTL